MCVGGEEERSSENHDESFKQVQFKLSKCSRAGYISGSSSSDMLEENAAR